MSSLVSSLVGVGAALAVPDFRKSEIVSGVQVFPDDTLKRVYYFAPGDIEMATNSEGRPKFQLVSTRYTGSTITGDQMAARNFNIASFGVRLRQIPREHFEAARATLRGRHMGRTIKLRALPVNRLVSHVTYAPANDPSAKTALSDGVLEDVESEADVDVSVSQGFWTRRTYSLKLSSEDAQILTSALDTGRVLISLSYAFMAKGIGSDVPVFDITGSDELTALVPTQTGAGSDQSANGEGLHVVRADTIGLALDTHQWPDLIKRIDLNEGMPPGYPMLWVRCYDFQDENTDDLYMKRIQIEAMSVDDKPILQEITFSAGDPLHNAERVKFNVAIRLDRPYRYRVVEVYGDGRQATDVEWTTQASWASTLDVTQDNDFSDASESLDSGESEQTAKDDL